MSEKLFRESPLAKVWLFIFLFALMGVGAYFLINKMKPGFLSSTAKTEPERIRQLNGYDKANLAKKDANPGDIFAALVRLAQQNDPVGLKESLARSQSEVKLVREGVAAALGYYDDAAVMPKLKELLKDSEITVRVQAIYASGRRQTQEREMTLKKTLEQENLSSDETIAVYSSLLQFSNSTDSKNKMIEQIAAEVMESNNINQKLQGLLILTQSGVKNAAINEMLKKILLDKDAQELAPVAIRNLGILRDQWFEKNLPNLMKNKDPQIRIASIGTLRFLCPVSRWTLLESLLKTETDPHVTQSVIEEIRAMPGAEAEALIKKVFDDKSEKNKMDSHLAATLKELLPSIGKSGSIDPCMFVNRQTQTAKEKN